jgi:hypothetical protein
MNPALLPLGAVLVSTVTGGGLWFVIRLVVRYQRDFTNRYALRIIEQEKYIEEMRAERHGLHRDLIACQSERGALRAMVRQAGIKWNPEDYGAFHERS